MNSEPRKRAADPLLTPFKIKSLELKNRIMSTSHSCGLHENGMTGERYQAYHEEKAKGGIALSMFGGSSNISVDSPSVFEQLYVGDDAVIPHFRKFSERMHRHGAALMCQITHLGRRGNPWAGQWLPTMAPSPVRETLHRSFPKEMDRADIDRVIKEFGDAAWRCREGGLDGIETMASSHLIGQFLSPETNKRTDEFGGSIENRTRFAILVHEEIRRRVGHDWIVGMRLSIDEKTAEGLTFDEAIEVARLLTDNGCVDFFNANMGMMDNVRSLAEENMPAMHIASAPWLEAVGRFKASVDVPVFHASKISDVATARHAISNGLLDMVAMTRAHIADPHIVRKLMAGTEDRIRPCVGATHCMSPHRPKCIHNAATGRETVFSHSIAMAKQQRKVVVVGGGPAGLEAARVAAERGHEVELLEANDVLGGQVVLAARAKQRQDLIGIVDWRIAELERLGVATRMNLFAEAEDIQACDPDVVIVATGGLPDLESFPGGELAVSTWDILSGAQKLSGHILVYDGTGRQAAAVAAIACREQGAQVAFKCLDGQFGEEMVFAERVGIKKRMFETRIPIDTDLRLVQLVRKDNALEATFVNELTREIVTEVCDHAVVERGTLPFDMVYHELAVGSRNGGVTDYNALVRAQPQPQHKQDGFELHRIGDAVASRNIASAITDAFRLCSVL